MPIPSESMPPQKPPTGTQKARKALKDAPRTHPTLLYFLVVSAILLLLTILMVSPVEAYVGCLMYTLGAVNVYVYGVHFKGR